MTALQVRGAHKRRGTTEVLRNIDLTVPEGGVVALLGRSGCGKTTLLRLLAGFDRCDAGAITLGDTVVDAGQTFVPSERRGIGYVPQEGLLFPHLTVAGNVGFGLSRAERKAGRIDDTLRLVGLDAAIGARQPHQLSGGQQQRVALARALAPRPRVILLDEPFNGLDGALRRSVAADVSDVLRRAGTTAILVTHDPQEAFATADTIAIMRDGVIVQCDDPATLYRRPADLDVARMTGPVLQLDGCPRDGWVDTVLGRIRVLDPWSQAAAAGPAQILLRPEQVVLAPAGHGVAVELRSAVFGGDHTRFVAIVGGTRLDLRLPGSMSPNQQVRVAVEGPGVVYRAATTGGSG